MALDNLFIRTPKSLAGIQLDGVITEAHRNTAQVTKSPVEFGAKIADHVIIEPKIFDMQAVVSDTPLGIAAFSEIVDTITGLFGTATTNNLTRSQAAYNALVQIMDQREPISVQTKLVLYQNFIITNIATIQDKTSSRIVVMDITIEEVIITQSEIITLPADQIQEGSARQQGASQNKRGRQEQVVPTDVQEKTVLKTIADWF